MGHPTKFRVWDGETMHEPSMRFRIYADGTVTQEHHGFGIACEDESQYEVMWDTGLEDDEGKRVWAGDILKTRNYYVVVSWNAEQGQWWAKGGRLDIPLELLVGSLEGEVVGNKFEDTDSLRKTILQDDTARCRTGYKRPESPVRRPDGAERNGALEAFGR